MSSRYDDQDEGGNIHRRIIREIVDFAKQNHVHMVVIPKINYGVAVGLDMTDLYADEPGGGNGTKVMQRFVELLDRHEVIGYTNPAGRRNSEFYRRFGFEWDCSPMASSTQMVRFPPTEDEG